MPPSQSYIILYDNMTSWAGWQIRRHTQIVWIAVTGYSCFSADVSQDGAEADEMVNARLRIRVDFEEGTILSPGKVRLFELVDQCGSVEEAAATIQMEIDRAQQVISRLEGLFGAPLVEQARGESDAQRLRLTELGRKVVERYRETERASALAADRLLNELISLTPDRQASEAGSR